MSTAVKNDKTIVVVQLTGRNDFMDTIIPYTNGRYGIIYLVILILGVEIPLLYSIFWCLSEKSGSADYSKAAKILKGVTIAGMLVILSSAF